MPLATSVSVFGGSSGVFVPKGGSNLFLIVAIILLIQNQFRVLRTMLLARYAKHSHTGISLFPAYCMISDPSKLVPLFCAKTEAAEVSDGGDV